MNKDDAKFETQHAESKLHIFNSKKITAGYVHKSEHFKVLKWKERKAYQEHITWLQILNLNSHQGTQ